jgi:hypothetical protein
LRRFIRRDPFIDAKRGAERAAFRNEDMKVRAVMMI